MASGADNQWTVGRNAWVALVVIVLGVGAGYYASHGKGRVLTSPDPGHLKVDGITSVAVDAQGNLYVGGGFGVRVFSPDRRLIREWKTSGKVAAIAVDTQGNVYAATMKQVEKFDSGGKALIHWGRGGCEGDEFNQVTGIAAADGNVFVADSGERVVYRFGEDGRYLNPIGAKEKDPDGMAIILPTPFLDCAAGDGVLFLNNPGRKRVEEYDFEGKLLKFWGKDGWKDDEFPGCCNPTHIALVGKDRIAVSEKGTPRVKVFDREGRLLKLLGADVFEPDCKGIDLAVDANGRIYAVDAAAGCIRVFEGNN